MGRNYAFLAILIGFSAIIITIVPRKDGVKTNIFQKIAGIVVGLLFLAVGIWELVSTATPHSFE